MKASFARYGAPAYGEMLQLHKGLFEETWDGAAIGRIALAPIDCDWYDPVDFSPKVCAERLSEGGLILIDGYNDHGGCRSTVDEFLRSCPGFTMDLGMNPILHKKSLGWAR